MYVAQTHSRTIAVQKYKKKLIYAKKKLLFLFIGKSLKIRWGLYAIYTLVDEGKRISIITY